MFTLSVCILAANSMDGLFSSFDRNYLVVFLTAQICRLVPECLREGFSIINWRASTPKGYMIIELIGNCIEEHSLAVMVI